MNSCDYTIFNNVSLIAKQNSILNESIIELLFAITFLRHLCQSFIILFVEDLITGNN